MAAKEPRIVFNREDKTYYPAFRAKDARFDGHFFVGVSSTGIYCRPVCRAKLPRVENCTFFSSAAAAEQAGFRPCLLCRPERAPGAAPVDAMASLAHRAARLLEAGCSHGQSIEDVAARLGCTGRHLRRAFVAQYGVPPARYVQTCRLLLAKSLLTDTDLSVIDVAMAAGFGSLRRFNGLFKNHYRLTPTALRRQAGGGHGGNQVTLALGYRPPYQWQKILDFLALRAIPGVECVADGCYFRTVQLVTPEQQRLCGWIQVRHRPREHALAVTVDAALLPVLPEVLARVRRLFDLCADPDVVYETLAGMNDIRPGLCVAGVRLPGCFDAFEVTVRAVLGQQITVKAARTLAARLVQAFGTPVQTGMEGLTHVFPLPGDVLAAVDGVPADHRLTALGIARARARTILALAHSLAEGGLDLGAYALPDATVKKLLTLPGIGSWTAQYIAMRALGWPDAFPHTDYGVKKALAPRTPAEIIALAETWRPWRSYATIYLWNSLQDAGVPPTESLPS